MKYKYTLSLLILLLCTYAGHAQKTFEQSFGGDGNGEWQDDLKTMKRNGYLVTGSTENFGAGNYDAYCVRLNDQGKMIWSKTYGTALSELGTKCYGTSDGGFLLSFSSHRPGNEDTSVFIVKCDEAGNVQWSKCIRDARAGVYRPAALYESKKGEYYLLYDWNETTYYGQKFALLKFDKKGALIWEKQVDTKPLSTFGSTQVGELNDGTILVCGISEGDNWTTYGSYIHLFQFAPDNGTIKQCKKICYGNCGAGTYVSADNFVVKNNVLYMNGGFSDGEYKSGVCWFPVNPNKASIQANYITIADPYTNNGFFYTYQYLINRHLMTQPEQGYSSILNFTPDGGYLNAYRYSAGSPTYYDIIVDKHDSLGRICPKFKTSPVDTSVKSVSFHIDDKYYVVLANGIRIKDSMVSVSNVTAQRGICAGTRAVSANEAEHLTALNIDNKSKTIWRVYPNPAKSFITIKYQSDKPAAIEFRIMTTGGKTVLTKHLFAIAGGQQTTLNIQTLLPGVYFIKAIGLSDPTVIKLLKQE